MCSFKHYFFSITTHSTSIMNISIYASHTEEAGFDQFLNQLYLTKMNYLASDLLREGLSPQDLVDAVRRAIMVCRNAGQTPREHFHPVYTTVNGALVRDCKLSRTGLFLVMMNANPEVPAVARWQMKMATANAR